MTKSTQPRKLGRPVGTTRPRTTASCSFSCEKELWAAFGMATLNKSQQLAILIDKFLKEKRLEDRK